MKLPNGFGGVRKLTGNRRKPYQAIIKVSYEKAEGKQNQKQKSLGCYSTREEALKALKEYNNNKEIRTEDIDQNVLDNNNDPVVFDVESEEKDDAVSKVIHLFEYIRELVGLKYKIVTDIERQNWRLYNESIQNDDNIYIVDNVSSETVDADDTLLRVHKVELDKCPEPPRSIIEWLKSDWDNFRKPAEVIDEIVSDDDSIELFEDDEERTTDFAEWLSKREEWVEEQEKKSKTRKLFQDLYDQYTDLKRESDTLEMMIGNGFISDKENSEIKHPILLKKVGFAFDAEHNDISIIDLDTKPELYLGLLQKIEGLNIDVIPDASDQLDQFEYHPLDNEETKEYLKRLIYKLSSESAVSWENEENNQIEDRLLLEWKPVFFVRKKIDGTYRAVGDIIKNVEETQWIPEHILDLAGIWENKELPEIEEYDIDELLARSCGESKDILLAKEANKEQLQIAERIRSNNAVIVQGPPGTGKTHTIANLIGDFLADGKSVLVTSHKEKALRVLKEKLPKEIQNLCVSLLDDSNRDMVKSVDGISDYMASHSSQEINREIKEIEKRRNAIIQELSETRKKVYAAKYKELESITYNGESYSVIEISRFVSENSEELSQIIPGKVEEMEFIFAEDELNELYKSNSLISTKEEFDITKGLPDPEIIAKPNELSDYLIHKKECDDEKKAIEPLINNTITIDWDEGAMKIENGEILSTIKKCDELEELPDSSLFDEKELAEWQLRAIYDGKLGGAHKSKWRNLDEHIKDTISFADESTESLLGKTITIDDPDDDYIAPLKKMKEKFESKGKLGRFDLIKKEMANAYNAIDINGKRVSSAADCQSAIDYIVLQNKRNDLNNIWSELIIGDDSVHFDKLGDDPERSCGRILSDVNDYLDWYARIYNKTIKVLESFGINGKILKSNDNKTDELAIARNDVQIVNVLIPKLVKLINDAYGTYLEKQEIDRAIEYIDGFDSDIEIVSALNNYLTDEQTDLYKSSYEKLEEVYDKHNILSRRNETLEKIAYVAPDWAKAIRNRKGHHGGSECPCRIEDAWKWKQFDLKTKKIIGVPLEKLQKRTVDLSTNLRKETEKLAAAKAWYHLLCRIERKQNIMQAINGWKLSVKKIGKGTGKNAAKYKRSAREKMKDCQSAVPAWIMPISKVLDNFNVRNSKFDVVIVDEASQSDVSALAVLYLAKKVVIVGDDQQVSPMSIGIEDKQVSKLIEAHIKGRIPHSDLYDPKTSLYDIASTTCRPLMLKEHFRCVPEIIGYSNRLSYDGKIKPLRDAGGTNIVPAIVPYRVNNGYREGKQKINYGEAKSIVALIAACIEQKEYENESIGVISLLGAEQGRLIQQELIKCLDASEIEKHNILCGDAANFQGDERDVIFLSMVDNNEGEGPLRLTGEGSGQSTKQRYNVAVSRARNQIWVVNSLDFANDLKEGDIRRGLLEYASNPGAFKYEAEEIQFKSDSPFEEEVASKLVSKGFHIEQQHEVGAYRIDIIVKYRNKVIAIECDGEAYHSGDEKIRKDMERQTILERLDWRFIRIRGCEYYRDKNGTMEKVFNKLEEEGIFPESNIDAVDSSEEPKLLKRVKARANEILSSWKEEGEAFEIKTKEETKPEEKPIVKKEKIVENQKAERKEQIERQQPEQIQKKKESEVRVDRVATKQKQSPKQMTILDVLDHDEDNKASGQQKTEKKASKKQEDNFLTEHLFEELEKKGLNVLDNREKSGLVWAVLDDSQKDKEFRNEIASIIESHGHNCRYEPRGALITSGKPAFMISVKGAKWHGKK